MEGGDSDSCLPTGPNTNNRSA